MSQEERRLYMAEYRKRNKERLNAQARTRYAGLTEEQKKALLQKKLAYHKANKESALKAKRKYYSSAKGKLQKKKEDEAYKSSGKRRLADMRREQKPKSLARLAAKLAYQLMRRSSEKELDDFSKFVLKEAVLLAKQRTQMLGTEWHVDHIRPISKGGTSHFTNIQVVPALWNRQKSNRSNSTFWNILGGRQDG